MELDIVNQFLANGFYLGGSRRMAEKYQEIKPCLLADFDIYGQNNEANKQFLKSKGFYEVDAQDKTYWDMLLASIWKHPTQVNIEVLLRHDAEGYRRAFESVPMKTYLWRLWKSNPVIKVDNKAAFRASVCAYFNVLFLQHGCTIPATSDELPF